MAPRIRPFPTPARTVVIVDDNFGFVGRLRERIKEAGCRPIWARDAHEALAAITHEKPALVLVYDGVPGVCDLELLAMLDRSPALARIPRLVLTKGGSFEGRDSPPWPVFFDRIDRALPDPPAPQRWPRAQRYRGAVARPR